MTTMMNSHLHPTRPKIIERSIESARNVFSRLHQIRKSINPVQAKILDDLYEFMTSRFQTNVDLTIYIRTDPEISMQRLKKRGRYEEREIKFEYLKLVGDLYDDWLLNNEHKKTIVLNGNTTENQIMEELEGKIKNLRY